jgi:hypothetical protein
MSNGPFSRIESRLNQRRLLNLVALGDYELRSRRSA